MLKSIKISNFQSHKDSLLEFSPGVNVIIGSSDCGKTAILRALRWVVWNQPLGTAFRSHWGGDTIVDLAVTEGQVQRVRTNKENMYVLDRHELKAIGADVPQEVRVLLNMDKDNVQSQLEAPYLLDANSGEVGRHFSRIAHLDKIITSTQLVEKWTRAIQQDIAQGQHREGQLEQELKLFAPLDYLEGFLKNLEQTEDRRNRSANAHRQLEGLIEQIGDAETALEGYSNLYIVYEGVSWLSQIAVTLTNARSNLQALARLEEGIDSAEADLAVRKELLAVEPLLKRMQKAQAELKEKQSAISQLKGLLVRTLTTEQAAEHWKESVAQREEALRKEFPDVCPLCGTVIKTKGKNQK